ncbi:MAG TPA: hypothetical protein VGA37_16740 [Gemmatimonadales bacterium]
MPAGSVIVLRRSAWILALMLVITVSAHAQNSASVPPELAGDELSNLGVAYASALVDSVFVDRTRDSAWVRAGDFASYLMARLNIDPIPTDLRFRVVIDGERIRMHGRIADLPLEARAALGPLLGMFPLGTRVAGVIDLSVAAREVVRFHLASVEVNGVPLPEGVVGGVMFQVGKDYPALSRTGRDLFVQVPTDAQIVLVPGGVVLRGPPRTSPDSSPPPLPSPATDS